MTPAILSGELSSVERQSPASSRIPVARDALDQGTIAELAWMRIPDMSRDELVRVIQNAHLPFLSDEVCAHLPFHDRPTLERLANLARRCCPQSNDT